MNFIINLQVYPFDVMVSIGETPEYIKKNLLKKQIMIDESELTIPGNARSMMFSGGQSLLLLKHKPKTNFDYATLQHEIFHIVEFVMTKIGIVLSNTSDEAFAYLIQYLTYEIYNKLDSIK